MLMEISVVIPVYNEVENVPLLAAQLAAAADGDGRAWEFLFIDDGSQDGTWEALERERQRDQRVRAVRLLRNFGQTAATACGIAQARGRRIVTMDGDLQNDPGDIPRLLAVLEQGYDVVCGWRRRRQDRFWTRRLPSWAANRLISLLTGVRLHDVGCSLKAYRAEVIRRVPLYAEFHRFIPALAVFAGALLTEREVTHHPRRHGCTKYNLGRTWRVALDMVTVSLLAKFASKPLRVFGTAALACLGGSILTLAALPAFGVPLAAAVLGLWLAGHLMGVGLLAELGLASAHARPEQSLITEPR
jgi:glycosyltransferase involved in cell wall biosynthesis